MKKDNLVYEFVEDLFDLYGLNKFQFFYDLDEETFEQISIPFIVDEKLVNTLGMTIEEINSMDKDAALRWWNKYPFFKYFKDYQSQWAFYSKHSDETTPKELLLEAIFSDEDKIDTKKRYNYKDVKQRLIKQLEEIDRIVPGTYHNGATITNLQISTEVFITFPDAPKMLASFIDIYDKVEQQFFRALKEELSEEEIKEYNFLVSWLQMTDLVMPSYKMTYDFIKKWRNSYLKENYKKLTSYAKVRSFIPTSPWRCKEFFDDITLVQRFAEIFPQAKAEMRKFAMEVSNFECFFTWSDAPPITYSPEEEEELKEISEIVNDEYIEPEFRPKEPTTIYVSKTKDELFDWEKHSLRLKQISASVSRGGLAVPKPEASILELYDTRRILGRFGPFGGGNTNE